MEGEKRLKKGREGKGRKEEKSWEKEKGGGENRGRKWRGEGIKEGEKGEKKRV